jgi:hypothetical protein
MGPTERQDRRRGPVQQPESISLFKPRCSLRRATRHLRSYHSAYRRLRLDPSSGAATWSGRMIVMMWSGPLRSIAEANSWSDPRWSVGCVPALADSGVGGGSLPDLALSRGQAGVALDHLEDTHHRCTAPLRMNWVEGTAQRYETKAGGPVLARGAGNSRQGPVRAWSSCHCWHREQVAA